VGPGRTDEAENSLSPDQEMVQARPPRDPEIEIPHFTMLDLDSYNGTFVNGVPIKEQVLKDGDQISVGDTVLLFLLHDRIEGVEGSSELDEDNLITRSTVRLRNEDALYLRPDRVSTELPPTARLARDLNTLLKISRSLSSVLNLTDLYNTVFKLIHEVIPAERQAILLTGQDDEKFDSLRGWTSRTGPDDSIKISKTVTTQVLREGVALLSNDLFDAAGLDDAVSLMETPVCSLLCVPLITFGKTRGVIYLDTSHAASRFDEGHLQLLTAIAGIAATAFDNARHCEWIASENQRLQKEIGIEHQMIGESKVMRAVYQFIGKAAPSDSTILIRGESGTGKELAAHAIHANSRRSAKPFIAINGATLSETLLESELFGHERGAFTGAIAQKRGKLEIADGGTLFLDEVGELTPLIQAKLLRVIQEREFERVGSATPIKTDVRIVAATNKNLEQAVSAGTFRQDLYYRLNVVTLTMPPLRERRDDIQLLAKYFASVFSKKCKRRIQGISAEARALLRAYDWPGNVRELQNVIERAVVLGSSDLITQDDLSETLYETGNNSLQLTKYHEQVMEAKCGIIIKALEESGGNYTEAAKRLGLLPTNLHRLVRSLNLRESLKNQGSP
jgi:Nif-specific regulatory protein